MSQGEMLSTWKVITEKVGLSENTIRKLIRDEGFPVQFLGRTPVTTMDQVISWLDRRLAQQKAKTCQ